MTRIALASDSHNGSLHLERFLLYCKREAIDRVFHLGDFEGDAQWLKRQLDIPLDAVAGNCDYHPHCPREARVNVEGKRMLLVHGDRFSVRYGGSDLSYYAEEQGMSVALYGHTHRAFVGYVGSILLINPGALKDGSFCLLEVSEKDIVPRILDIDEWYAQHPADQ